MKLFDKNDDLVRYKCVKNNEPGIVEFTPKELIQLTEEKMQKYLNGDKHLLNIGKERGLIKVRKQVSLRIH